MCLDGPTFVATEGWDWIPAIRDRDTGIWQPVTLPHHQRREVSAIRKSSRSCRCPTPTQADSRDLRAARE